MTAGATNYNMNNMTTVHYKLVQTLNLACYPIYRIYSILNSRRKFYLIVSIIATIWGIIGMFEKHNWSKIEHNWERPTALHMQALNLIVLNLHLW